MKTLVAQVFAGAINPGQLQIVREILNANDIADIDIAVYRGNQDDYLVEVEDGFVRVTDLGSGFDDGVDTLYNMEKIRFAGGVEIFINNQAPVGAPVISDTTPTQGFALTANTSSIQDPNGMSTSVFSYRWYSRANEAAVWTVIAGATLATFTPTAEALVGQQLRVVVTFTDDQGTVETLEVRRPTAIVGDNFLGNGLANVYVGTAGADYVLGLGGIDTLSGGDGDDFIDGGLANDLIDGGDGNDTLIGGANGGADTILGGAGNDSIDGGAGNDNLSGGDGNDIIVGGDGTDVLNGGVGADTMSGGNGNDDYFVDDIGDTVSETATGGAQDDVFTTLNAYTLPTNVERLFFNGTGSFVGTGNASNNQITGGDQADILDGGAGTDQMIGLAGNDTYYVDNAADTTMEAVDGGTTLSMPR